MTQKLDFITSNYGESKSFVKKIQPLACVLKIWIKSGHFWRSEGYTSCQFSEKGQINSYLESQTRFHAKKLVLNGLNLDPMLRV